MPEQKKKRPTRRVATAAAPATPALSEPEYVIRAQVIGNELSGLPLGLHYLEKGTWEFIPMDELTTLLPGTEEIVSFEDAMDTVMETQPPTYKGGAPVHNKPPNRLMVLVDGDQALLVNGMELVLRREHSLGARTYVCQEQVVLASADPAEWAKMASARISAKVKRVSKRSIPSNTP